MKWHVTVCLVVIQISSFAQGAVSDTLFCALVHQSILTADPLTFNVYSVVGTAETVLKDDMMIARDIAYFTDEDIHFAHEQIKQPLITSWDIDIFKASGLVNVVNDAVGGGRMDQCLFVSLPLISKDGNAILIYFEYWQKVGKRLSSQTFATVWTKKPDGEWTLARQQVVSTVDRVRLRKKR